MLIRPFTRLSHPRELIRQFTPNWFAATMGTGILALALNQVPIAPQGLKVLAEAIWLGNIVLFIWCSLMYAARWTFFTKEAARIFQHGIVSMFFGTIPMGLATIVNGFLMFGIARWGDAAFRIAYDLWWLDAIMALACAWLVPYLMFTRHDHSLEKMTAVWLLPFVAAEVTAASGGLLLGHMQPSADAVRILYLSYALWALSVLPAMGILTILFLRMVLHRLPGRDMAASSWLSLGPIGTGSLGLLLLGENAPRVLTGPAAATIGLVAHGLGIIGGSILWGYGLWWFAIATLITLRYLKGGLPFNLGWWGFTFPIGVYAVATLNLGRQTGVEFFQVLGCGFVGLLAFLWIIVAWRTIHGAYHGQLFVAPCLTNYVTPEPSSGDLLPAHEI